MTSDILTYENTDGNIKIDVRLGVKYVGLLDHRWGNCSARVNAPSASILVMFLVKANLKKTVISNLRAT